MKRKRLFTTAALLLIAVFVIACSKKEDDTGKMLALLALSQLPVLDVSAMAPADLQVLKLRGQVLSVDMNNGQPKVTFAIATDTNRLKGFGWTTKTTGSYNSTTGIASTSSTVQVTNLTAVSNMQFGIAKLVPATSTSPNKWVNYIVTTIPQPDGVSASGVASPRVAALTWPSNDTNGTIVDNGDGTYVYTFARNITNRASDIGVTYAVTTAGAPTTTSVAARMTNVGTLTYEPNLPHRVCVFIGGSNVRGTSSNNPDGTNVPVMNGGVAVAAITFDNPTTAIYDFIPATGQVLPTQRDIVRVETCNVCHKDPVNPAYSKRGLSVHGTRNNVLWCVVCHTDQVKVGTHTLYSNVASAAYAYLTKQNNYLLDGYSVGDFPIMVHKLHMGTKLRKIGDGYNLHGLYFTGGVTTSSTVHLVDFPAPQNCMLCHTSNKIANDEDNWKTKPSRLACGSCHDGLNFATGALRRIKDGVDTLHNVQVADTGCKACHSAASIATYHGL